MKKLFILIASFVMLLGMSSCKKEHTHNLVSHESNDPTCTEVGYYAYEECLECDYTTYEEIEALGHDLEHHESVASTCTKEGIQEYWYCDVCKTYYTDEEGNQVINYEELIIDTIDHDLEYYASVGSTCTEDGIQEYWYCDVCKTYYTDEEGSQIINEEDLVIKKEHIDENNDYVCDYDCGNVLITKEKLQKIIIDTLSSTKVTVNDFYTPSLTRNSYYFDENLLYIINDEEQEKYYYTDNEIAYLLTKTDEWKKEVTSEDISYTLSYLFEETYDLEIAENIRSWTYGNGSLIDEKLIRYTNSLGLDVALKINEDGTLLDAILFFDEGGNFIHEFIITYGENVAIGETLKDINNYLDGNK